MSDAAMTPTSTPSASVTNNRWTRSSTISSITSAAGVSRPDGTDGRRHHVADQRRVLAVTTIGRSQPPRLRSCTTMSLRLITPTGPAGGVDHRRPAESPVHQRGDGLAERGVLRDRHDVPGHQVGGRPGIQDDLGRGFDAGGGHGTPPGVFRRRAGQSQSRCQSRGRPTAVRISRPSRGFAGSFQSGTAPN